MTALSNAKPRRGEANPPTIGPAPNVIPKAQGSDTGVSVRSVHPPTEWFVLRITYNRAQKANGILSDNGIKTYMPMRYATKTVNGRKRRITIPLLPNILFAYTDHTTLNNLLQELKTTSRKSANDKNHDKLITYYYDHFHTGNDGKNSPLTVSDRAMQNFIRLTSLTNEHIRLVRSDQCHYKSGDIVRIIDGEFNGICGRVARVAGQQRVVVELEGVCLVTTAYVPSGFIQKEKQNCTNTF